MHKTNVYTLHIVNCKHYRRKNHIIDIVGYIGYLYKYMFSVTLYSIIYNYIEL